MSYLKKSLFMLTCSSILLGCAINVGSGMGALKLAEATQESLEKQCPIETTTRDDVASQLGAPTRNSVAGSYEIWKYLYMKESRVTVIFVSSPVATKKDATFYFDHATGVLKKFEFQEQ
jgi:hypothetical protein